MSGGRLRLSAASSPEAGAAEWSGLDAVGKRGVVASFAASAAIENIGSFALGNGGAACATTGAKISATTEKSKKVDSNGRTDFDARASQGRKGLVFMV
jgi:hypothetical protein